MPFEDEERKQAQAKMANTSQYDEMDCEYFVEQKDAFVQFLVGKGIREAKARLWLAKNGAYEADHELVTKAINAGNAYKPPEFFEPDQEEIADYTPDEGQSVDFASSVRPKTA